MSAALTQLAASWTEDAICAYLESLGFRDIEYLREVGLSEIGMSELKGFGFGRPVLLEFKAADGLHRLVLHTASADQFGHDWTSDRAASLLLARESFNHLPRHVTSLDVGAFTKDGRMISLGRAAEFFLLTQYTPGIQYARDLERIRERGQASATDERRARRLALYLADIHRAKHTDPALYRRRIRDLVGHGEGIMGLADSYPLKGHPEQADFLRQVEHAAVEWRWRLRGKGHRLAQVHGDFHPFNILFESDGEFHLLDRSRGEWGEPADDLAALSINYLFFALRSGPSFTGPLRRLFDLFWKSYLEASGDQECLRTAPPFFAWRGLVVASPVWYPSLSDGVRERLFRFVRNVLADRCFRPESVERYLEEARR